jgi:phosphatidyl-myo-inositol alpha-mannosyltransferase
VKVGIVVPYSWSFWGGVVDHADQQARALNRLGIETRTIIGCDPPGRLTRALHPRVVGRPERPPPRVLPVGRTAIVPANGSVANIVLAPQAYFRIRRILERESFDLLHLHELSIPIPCMAALLLAETPLVATFHASGTLPWLRIAKPIYGFLLERLDHRLAVSQQALASAARHFPGKYEVLANGVALPERADPSERQHQLVFVGRNEPRKGLEVLLRSWPCVWAATGARLRVIGTDPRSVRLLLARHKLPSDGIDLLGIVSDAELTEELRVAKLLVAPSLGRESFGMVLTRAFACATPVVASDIAGYQEVVTAACGVLVPPDQPQSLAAALVDLLEDEPARCLRGAAARELAEERYSWDRIGLRLVDIYDQLVHHGRPVSSMNGDVRRALDRSLLADASEPGQARDGLAAGSVAQHQPDQQR